MYSAEVYNYFDGKHLCNFFSNLIVEELKKYDPKSRTEITVINSRNFFVVRGYTSSETVLNLTDILTEGLKRINPSWSGYLNVIDVIYYNHTFKDTPLHLNLKFDSSSNDELQNFVNSHAKNGLFFNMKIDNITSVIFYDCKEEDKESVNTILKENYPKYKIFKSDFSNDVYVSDRYYGLSMNHEKPYHVLLKNISKHIFRMGITKKVSLSIFSENPLDEIDNLNIDLKIKNERSLVKKGWLRSLILDLFPFSEKDIISDYNLDQYNCEVEIIPSDDEVNLPYESMYKISEFLLI